MVHTKTVVTDGQFWYLYKFSKITAIVIASLSVLIIHIY